MNPSWGVEIPGGFYDDAKHLYRNENGTIVPSVTQVFTLLGLSDFSNVPADMLEWKRTYGSAVHMGLEFLVAGDLDWDSLDMEIIAPVVGIEQWLKKNQYVSVATEKSRIVSVFGMQFGMRLDHRGTFVHQGKERSVILDLKTACKEEPVWRWQLGAYALGQEKTPLGWMGVVLKVDKEGLVKPFYYDLIIAVREFQILLSACILGLNAGLYRVAKA